MHPGFTGFKPHRFIPLHCDQLLGSTSIIQKGYDLLDGVEKAMTCSLAFSDDIY